MNRHAYQLYGSNIVYEMFENEAVAVNLDTGKYYSMRQLSALLWEALLSKYSVESIAEKISTHYAVNLTKVKSDINNFIEILLKEDLIKTNENFNDANIACFTLSGEYQVPTVEIFSDMQEILLLDPVHDVDTAGWPVAQKEKVIEKS